jgi:predicted small lipoprotein YifL
MKRLIPAILILVLLLALSSCGGKSPEPDAGKTTPEISSPSPTPLPQSPEPETGFSVEILSESDTRMSGEFQVASYSFDFPVIHADVADDASAAAENWAESFYKDRAEWALSLMDEAERVYSEMPEFFLEPYFYTESLETVYSGKELHTLISTYSSYMGGNHPSHGQEAINLCLSTGKVLTLPDLGDAEEIIRLAEEDILRQIQEQDLAGEMYENYADFVASGIVDGYWYLTEDGFSVIYTEYYLAPYSSGSFVFTVPFEALEGALEPWVQDIFLTGTV